MLPKAQDLFSSLDIKNSILGLLKGLNEPFVSLNIVFYLETITIQSTIKF